MAVSTTVDAKIIGRWVDRLTRPSKKDFAKFERVAQKALKRIAIGAAAAGAALVKLTTSTLDQVSALNDVAERTDFTVERLQTLRFAFGQVGATATETDQSLRRFTRRLGLAAQEGGPAAAEFERLNIAVRNIDGSIRGSEEVFDDVVRAIGRMSSAAERAAAASAFFGEDAGPALAPLLGQGIAAIKSYEDELRSLNGVLSEDLVQQAAAAKNELNVLGQAVRANFQAGFISGFVDEFDTFAAAVRNPKFLEGVRLLAEDLGGLLVFIVEHQREIATFAAAWAALSLSLSAATLVPLGKKGGKFLPILRSITAVLPPLIAALTTYLSLSKDTAKAQKDLAEQGPKVTIEMEKQVKAWEKSAAAVKKFNEAERDLLEVQRDLLKSRLAPKEEELKRQLENLERLREKEQELLETIRNANEERAKIAQLVADAEKTVAEALGPGAERDPVKRIRALRKEAREFGVIQNRADLERANALLSKVVSFRRTLGEDSSQLFPSRKLIKDILGDIREAGFRLEQQQARQVKTGEKELNRIRDAIQTAEQSIKPLRATVEFIRKTLSEIEAIIRFEDEAALRAKARKIHRDMMKEFPPIIQRVQVQRLGGGRLDLTPQFGGANPPGGGPGSGGFDATVPGTRFTPVPGPAFDLSPKVPAFQAGTRRVPRDTLAFLHKDEAVLNPRQADRFRSGGLGVRVGTINVNVSGVTTDRSGARKLARLLRQELERVEDRRSG